MRGNRIFGMLGIALAVCVSVTACSERAEEKRAGESGGAGKSEEPVSVKGEDLGVDLVYAEEAVWESSCGKALERPPADRFFKYDSFFVVVNSNNPEPQHPVAEIGPPRPDYNGRWRTFTVTWTEEGFLAHETVPIIESYSDILTHGGLGHLRIAPGSPTGGPPAFFSCTLKPWTPETE